MDLRPDLLCVLFKQTQLETLVQLQLPHVPQLLQVLASPMQLIQYTSHFSNEVVSVCMCMETMMMVAGISTSAS